VRLWDVVTGKPLGAPMKHDGPVYLNHYARPDLLAIDEVEFSCTVFQLSPIG
jgi:hypothetical protein